MKKRTERARDRHIGDSSAMLQPGGATCLTRGMLNAFGPLTGSYRSGVKMSISSASCPSSPLMDWPVTALCDKCWLQGLCANVFLLLVEHCVVFHLRRFMF
jgi:hypothetical protein